MWKWIGWAGQLIGAALLVSFLSIWTTGYIVTSYVQSALKEYGVTLDQQPFAMSGIWGKLWGADGVKTAEQKGASADEGDDANGGALAGPSSGTKATPNTDSAAGSPTATPDAAAGGGAAAPTNDGNASYEPSPEPGPEPTGSTRQDQAAASPDAGTGDGAVPAWSGDEGASGVSGLTDEEKQQIYSVVVSKLSSEQLSELTGLIQNGLTGDEVTKVEALLKPILSDEEYATMMEALKVPVAQ